MRRRQDPAVQWRLQQNVAALQAVVRLVPRSDTLPALLLAHLSKIVQSCGSVVCRRDGHLQSGSAGAAAGGSIAPETVSRCDESEPAGLTPGAVTGTSALLQRLPCPVFSCHLLHHLMFLCWEEVRRDFQGHMDSMARAAGWRLTTGVYAELVEGLGLEAALLGMLAWLPAAARPGSGAVPSPRRLLLGLLEERPQLAAALLPLLLRQEGAQKGLVQCSAQQSAELLCVCLDALPAALGSITAARMQLTTLGVLADILALSMPPQPPQEPTPPSCTSASLSTAGVCPELVEVLAAALKDGSSSLLAAPQLLDDALLAWQPSILEAVAAAGQSPPGGSTPTPVAPVTSTGALASPSGDPATTPAAPATSTGVVASRSGGSAAPPGAPATSPGAPAYPSGGPAALAGVRAGPASTSAAALQPGTSKTAENAASGTIQLWDALLAALARLDAAMDAQLCSPPPPPPACPGGTAGTGGTVDRNGLYRLKARLGLLRMSAMMQGIALEPRTPVTAGGSDGAAAPAGQTGGVRPHPFQAAAEAGEQAHGSWTQLLTTPFSAQDTSGFWAACGEIPGAVQACAALVSAGLFPGLPRLFPLLDIPQLTAVSGPNWHGPLCLGCAVLDILVHAVDADTGAAEEGAAAIALAAMACSALAAVGERRQQEALYQALGASPGIQGLQARLAGSPSFTSSASRAVVAICNRMVRRQDYEGGVVLGRDEEALRVAAAAQQLLPVALLLPSAVVPALVAEAVRNAGQQPMVLELLGVMRHICQAAATATKSPLLPPPPATPQQPGDARPTLLASSVLQLLCTSTTLGSGKEAAALSDLCSGLAAGQLLSWQEVLRQVVLPAFAIEGDQAPPPRVVLLLAGDALQGLLGGPAAAPRTIGLAARSAPMPKHSTPSGGSTTEQGGREPAAAQALELLPALLLATHKLGCWLHVQAVQEGRLDAQGLEQAWTLCEQAGEALQDAARRLQHEGAAAPASAAPALRDLAGWTPQGEPWGCSVQLLPHVLIARRLSRVHGMGHSEELPIPSWATPPCLAIQAAAKHGMAALSEQEQEQQQLLVASAVLRNWFELIMSKVPPTWPVEAPEAMAAGSGKDAVQRLWSGEEPHSTAWAREAVRRLGMQELPLSAARPALLLALGQVLPFCTDLQGRRILLLGLPVALFILITRGESAVLDPAFVPRLHALSIEVACRTCHTFLLHSTWAKQFPGSVPLAADRFFRHLGGMVQAAIQGDQPASFMLASRSLSEAANLTAALDGHVDCQTLQNLMLAIIMKLCRPEPPSQHAADAAADAAAAAPADATDYSARVQDAAAAVQVLAEPMRGLLEAAIQQLAEDNLPASC